MDDDADDYQHQVIEHLRNHPDVFVVTNRLIASATSEQVTTLAISLCLLCVIKFVDGVTTWECAKAFEQSIADARDAAILAAMPDNLRMQ